MFVFGPLFAVPLASLVGRQRTSWVRFPFSTSWPLFSVAQLKVSVVLALLGQGVGTRLLQGECGKRNRSPAEQWDLSQTEVTAHRSWDCPWITGALLCTADWGEQTGTCWWSELPVRKHPVKFPVNYFLDGSLKTFVLVPLVYRSVFWGW